MWVNAAERGSSGRTALPSPYPQDPQVIGGWVQPARKRVQDMGGVLNAATSWSRCTCRVTANVDRYGVATSNVPVLSPNPPHLIRTASASPGDNADSGFKVAMYRI